MDVGSHFLCGVALAVGIPEATLLQRGAIVAGSVVPDLLTLPLYVVLANKIKRPINQLTIENWDSFGQEWPWLTWSYFLTHSTVFLVPLVVAGTFWPVFMFLALGWFVHQLYDWPTHKGIWRIKPLYPLSSYPWPWPLTDAWVWPLRKMATSWVIHLFLIGSIYILTR